MLAVPSGFVWCEYTTEAVIGLRVPMIDLKSLNVFEIMERDFGVMNLGTAPPNLESVVQVLNTMKAGQGSEVTTDWEASPVTSRPAVKQDQKTE